MLGRGLDDKVLDVLVGDERDHWRRAALTGPTQKHALLEAARLQQPDGLFFVIYDVIN